MKVNESKYNKTLKVLWVDDDFIISESANILVTALGHKCDNVMSGKEALEQLNKSTYDVVFSDIGMPEMNGWELTKLIRKKFDEEITIVSVTGWKIDEEILKENKIDYLLQKPFTLEQLKKTFEKILENKNF